MRYLLPILLILLTISLVAAQSDYSQYIFDEEDIFTENLAIVERHAIMGDDRDSMELDYFNVNEGVWQSFPYPEGYEYILGVRPYFDDANSYIVYQRSPEAGTSAELLDVTTGEYSPVMIPCDLYFPWLPNDVWIIQGENLCKISTGELIPLPTEILELNIELNGRDANSEFNTCANTRNNPRLLGDLKTVIIPICSRAEQYLFSFDTESFEYKELIHLELGSLRLLALGNNQTFFAVAYLEGGDTTTRSVSLYKIVADTGETEIILEEVSAFYPLGINPFQENYQQFSALRLQDGQLKIFSYDFFTEVLQDLGTIDCATLPHPCENIKALREASLDAGYLVLQADVPNNLGMTQSQSFIVSTASSNLVHTMPVETFDGEFSGWISPNEYYYYFLEDKDSRLMSLNLLEFDGDEVVSERRIENAETHSPDWRYVLHWEDASKDRLFALDLQTGENFLLLDSPEETFVSALYLPDGRLLIELRAYSAAAPVSSWYAELNPILESE